ncbi:MAG: hypothetical protein FJX25_15765 [Alphaproteobacteria bacterium]|nr:hypothetical protein [Alphaproteobacteria bacterium]
MIQTFRRFFLAWVVCASLGCAAHAATGTSAAWSEALHGSSDRLLLYALSNNPPADARPLMASMIYDLGATQAPLPVRYNWEISPILSWDGNFNNRTPGKSFNIAGFHFVVDPESRAVGGLVLGALTTASAKWRYRFASTLTLTGWASAETLPEADMSRKGLGMSLCASDYRGDWIWFDACVQQRILDPALDDPYGETRLSAGPTWLSKAKGATYEMAPHLGLNLQEGQSRPSVGLDYSAAVPDLGATNFSIEAAKHIPDWHGVTFSARAGLARSVFRKSTAINLQYDQVTGGRFFGEPRRDNVFTVGVNRRVSDQATASFGWRRVKSSVGLYDEAGFTMALSFASWTF